MLEHWSMWISQVSPHFCWEVKVIDNRSNVLVYFVANKIIKPILYLADCANEISRGKLEDKIEVKTNDEILNSLLDE